MFFDLIRPVLCEHDGHWLFNNTITSISPQIRSFIQCTECPLNIDVAQLILNFNPNDPISSIQLAYEYARLTANVHIPCKFIVSKIDGILPHTITTELFNIIKGIELLKAVNSPFLTIPDGTDPPPPPNRKLFENLMDDYLNLFSRLQSPSSSSPTALATDDKESIAIRAIVSQIKNAFSHINFFDQYFKILVPYVKSLMIPHPRILKDDENTFSNTSDSPPIPIIGDIFYRELERAQLIRQTYSKYCVAFDVAYVTILCYICGDDADVLYNLVLDLSARLCTGYFVLAPVRQTTTTTTTGTITGTNNQSNQTLAQTIATFLSKHITPTQNIQLYYHLQKFKRDEVEECFSEEFLKHFGDLGDMVRKQVGLEQVILNTPAYIGEGDGHSEQDERNAILKYGYQQTYPYLLFEGKDWEFYGFVMALAHYVGSTGHHIGNHASHNPNRKLTKGILSNSRKIYRFIKRAILQIRAFENSFKNENNLDTCIWTRDVLNLFLCADSNFETELMSMLNTLITSAQDLEETACSSSSSSGERGEEGYIK